METDDKVTLAKLGVQLDNVIERLDGLARKFETSVVSRREWELRNDHVDSKLTALDGDVGELKAAKAPWWTWVTIGALVIGLIWQLITPVITKLFLG